MIPQVAPPASRFYPLTFCMQIDQRGSSAGISTPHLESLVDQLMILPPEYINRLSYSVTGDIFLGISDPRERCRELLKQVSQQNLWGTLSKLVLNAFGTPSDPSTTYVVSGLRSILHVSNPAAALRLLSEVWLGNSRVGAVAQRRILKFNADSVEISNEFVEHLCRLITQECLARNFEDPLQSLSAPCYCVLEVGISKMYESNASLKENIKTIINLAIQCEKLCPFLENFAAQTKFREIVYGELPSLFIEESSAATLALGVPGL